MKKLSIVLIAILMVTLLAGCNQGGSNDDSVGTTTNKTDFYIKDSSNKIIYYKDSSQPVFNAVRTLVDRVDKDSWDMDYTDPNFKYIDDNYKYFSQNYRNTYKDMLDPSDAKAFATSSQVIEKFERFDFKSIVYDKTKNTWQVSGTAYIMINHDESSGQLVQNKEATIDETYTIIWEDNMWKVDDYNGGELNIPGN